MLTRECVEEIRSRMEKGKKGSTWEEERKKYFAEREMEIGDVKRRRREGGLDIDQLLVKDMEMDRGEKRENIRNFKYNRWYGQV